MQQIKTFIAILLCLCLSTPVYGANTKAERIRTDVTNFDHILSSGDTDVQAALETIDEMVATASNDTQVLLNSGDDLAGDAGLTYNAGTDALTVAGALAAATLDTGQGANELYDMDQNVLTTSNVTFNDITGTGTIEGNILTDGTLAIESGSITSAVNGTFSATLEAEHLYSTDDVVIDDDLSVAGQSLLGGVTEVLAAGGTAIYDSIVSQWKFQDDAANTTVADSFGSNTGALTGGDDTQDVSTTGIGSGSTKCFDLDGAADYVLVTDDDTLSFVGSPFSISCWVNLDVIDHAPMFFKGIDTTDFEWGLYIGPGDNLLRFSLWDESDSGLIIKYKDLVGQETNDLHIVGTYDGSGNQSGMTLYVNNSTAGTLDFDNGNFVGMENGNGDLTLGFFDSGGNKFLNGRLDNCILADEEWTVSEVAELYNSGNNLENINPASPLDVQVIGTSSSVTTYGGLNTLADLVIESDLEVQGKIYQESLITATGEHETFYREVTDTNDEVVYEISAGLEGISYFRTLSIADNEDGKYIQGFRNADEDLGWYKVFVNQYKQIELETSGTLNLNRESNGAVILFGSADITENSSFIQYGWHNIAGARTGVSLTVESDGVFKYDKIDANISKVEYNIPELFINETNSQVWINGTAGGAYDSSLRLTGESGESWLGGYMQYDASGNDLIIGVHNTEDVLTGSDIPVMVIARETGISTFLTKVAFTQVDQNEYWDSLNDGYLDGAATTGIRLTSPLTRVTGDLYVGNDADSDPVMIMTGDTLDGQLTWFEDTGRFALSHSLTITDPGSLLGTPVAGTFEFDANRMYLTNVSTQRAIDRSSCVKLTTTLVANTTNKIEIFNCPMAANSLVAGNQFEVKIIGIASNVSTSDVLTITVDVGGANILTLPTSARNYTNEDLHIDAMATQRTIGNPGSRAIHFDLVIGTDIATVNAVANINTEANMDISISAQWNNAKAGNTLSVYQGVMKFKN